MDVLGCVLKDDWIISQIEERAVDVILRGGMPVMTSDSCANTPVSQITSETIDICLIHKELKEEAHGKTGFKVSMK